LSYSKMSVLHLHLSDEPAARLESKAFPELTAHLGEQFYTQKDMKEFVSYSKARGVRVVPELDLPAHTGGLSPLTSRGLRYCDQGYLLDNDDTTKKIIQSLIKDWAAVFEDDVFHFGADEACKHDVCPANCTQDKVHDMQKMAQEFLSSIGKNPSGWSDVFTDPAGSAPNAALKGTTIQNWYLGKDPTTHKPDPSVERYVQKGFAAIQSRYDTMYLGNECCHVTNFPTVAHSTAKFCFYQNPAAGVQNAAYLPLVKGGEVAKWSDSYCGGSNCKINGTYSWMYPPAQDDLFQKSFMNQVFPGSTAAAAAFWNYNADMVDATTGRPTAAFTAALNAQTERILARGVQSCKPGCSCTGDTSCVGDTSAYYGGAPTPLAVSVHITNQCNSKVHIKQRQPCSSATGADIVVLDKDQSATVLHKDWIAVATVNGATSVGDPLSTWVGDSTWADEKYDFRLRCPPGGYIYYCEPDATDKACQ